MDLPFVRARSLRVGLLAVVCGLIGCDDSQPVRPIDAGTGDAVARFAPIDETRSNDTRHASAIKSLETEIAALKERIRQLESIRSQPSAKTESVAAAKLSEGESVEQWNAYNIAKKFDENEVAANKDWKDKKIRIYGDIVSVNVDANGVKVTLDGKFPNFVDCRFDSDQARQFETLKKGDRITIDGTCRGKGTLCIEFVDCSFVRKGVAW